jgi:hypothetical protein
MGNSMASVKLFSTNEHHKYQEVTYVEKGTDYNTIHIYESSPSRDSIPTFKKGGGVCFSLKDTLEANKVYSFSLMIKLDNSSSYGVDFMGCHFMNSFPSENEEMLWGRLPEQVIPVEDLLVNNGWVEKRILYTAKGGERYLALSAIYPQPKIGSNRNFVPQFLSSCGPNDGYCISRKVIYRDSLFANYFIDNVVCIPNEPFLERPSQIFDNSISQVEIIFSPIKKADDNKEEIFDQAKHGLINALNILRIQDQICVADVTKKDQLILEPYAVVNKKKIIRKIYKPDLSKKVKELFIPAEVVLFDGELVKGFNNHVIIILDDITMLSQLEYKLTKFDKNGGKLTFIYLDSLDRITDQINQLSIYTNALFLYPQMEDFENNLIRRLMLKM